MGAAYFIVLDNKAPGFDAFVNGKAIAREIRSLSRVAKSLGVKEPDEYVSVDSEEALAFARGHGIEEEIAVPAEQWFDPEEGLRWVAAIREQIQSHSELVKDRDAVLSDLTEYEQVLTQAKSIGAKWHLSVDF